MDTLTFDLHITAGEHTLVDIRGFEIPRNQVTFLFGESGIGKSLIARAIYGLLDPEEYHIVINGETYDSYLKKPETKTIKEQSFFVFQEPSSHLNPLLPLGVQLREGNLSHASDDAELLRELWEGSDSTEIQRLLEVYPKPYRPSGGEKQRMFLVMALKKMDIVLQSQRSDRPCLFVFDEPTGSLDNYFRDVFLSLLFRRFQQRAFTVLLITHDYSMISEVTGSHRALLDRVSFKELRRTPAQLLLREFRPETYLGWLDRQRKGPTWKPRSHTGALLLRVESGAKVFGQRLTITRDRAGTRISPLEIFPGAIAYLKAPSGTGKTTLVKMIMGLIHGSNMSLALEGKTLTERTPRRFWQREVWGKRMTMVFQHADEALNPRATVEETFHGLPSRRRVRREDIRRTLGELFEGEISDTFLRQPVAALSGGQKQRLNLLRGLFLNTTVLILDEPLNGLDFESSIKVLAMLEEQQRAGRGILLISHNEEIFDAVISPENVYHLHTERVS